MTIRGPETLRSRPPKFAPWHVVKDDDKRRARLNCIAHLPSLIPYKKIPAEKVNLPNAAEIAWIFGAGLPM